VGFSPGLTNLLASHCTSVLEDVRNVDIFLLLGYRARGGTHHRFSRSGGR